MNPFRTLQLLFLATSVLAACEPPPLIPRDAINGQGVVDEPAITAYVDDVVVLDAETLAESWRWRIAERPAASTTEFVESFFDNADPTGGGSEDDPSTPSALLFLDRPGAYQLEVEIQPFGGALVVQTMTLLAVEE